jgi:beta-xylosidase
VRGVRVVRALCGLLAVVAGIPAAGAAPPAAPTTTAAATLAYGGDFPDPFVFVNGGRYYAYSTQIWSSDHWTNVPVMTSTNLSSWSSVTDALPSLPGWARSGNTWAPAVVARSGRYVLYYTTTEASSGRQCISVATAATPTGPFGDSSTGPLLCQRSQGGSIDPYPFVDPRGALYLIWKSDNNALGQETALWSRQLRSDGLNWAPFSRTVQLLGEQPTGWHVPIEGPAMVWSQNRYYLFYGGGAWNSAGSGIGYATCKGPLGPCVDRTAAVPWLATGATDAVGPQGPTVFTDLTGTLRIGFSGWSGTVAYPGGVRAVWTGPLRFTNKQPTL